VSFHASIPSDERGVAVVGRTWFEPLGPANLSNSNAGWSRTLGPIPCLGIGC